MVSPWFAGFEELTCVAAEGKDAVDGALRRRRSLRLLEQLAVVVDAGTVRSSADDEKATRVAAMKAARPIDRTPLIALSPSG